MCSLSRTTSVTASAAQTQGESVTVSSASPPTPILTVPVFLDGGGTWTLIISASWSFSEAVLSPTGTLALFLDGVSVQEGRFILTENENELRTTVAAVNPGSHVVTLAGTLLSGTSFTVVRAAVTVWGDVNRLPSVPTPFSLESQTSILSPVTVPVPTTADVLLPVLSIDVPVPSACPYNFSVAASFVADVSDGPDAEGPMYLIMNPFVDPESGVIVPGTGTVLAGTAYFSGRGIYNLTSVGRTSGGVVKVYLVFKADYWDTPTFITISTAEMSVLGVVQALGCVTGPNTLTTTVSGTVSETGIDNLPTVTLDLTGYGQWSVMVTVEGQLIHPDSVFEFTGGEIVLLMSVNGTTPVTLTSLTYDRVQGNAVISFLLPYALPLPRGTVTFSTEFHPVNADGHVIRVSMAAAACVGIICGEPCTLC